MENSISNRKLKTLVNFIFAVILTVSIIIVLPTMTIFAITDKLIYSTETIDNVELTEYKTGIVFGASVTPDRSPSTVLKDRLDVAAILFNKGIINKIVLSGNDEPPYDEVSVMRNYLLEKYTSITDDVLILDGYGYRTYDTCIRSKKVSNIHKAILITSGYHLPRAIILCQKLGIDSYGVSSTLSEYRNRRKFYIREIMAINKALMDLYILEPDYLLDDYLHESIDQQNFNEANNSEN